MLIKTIVNKINKVEEFDREVNEALANGWAIEDRYIHEGVNNSTLVAQMVKKDPETLNIKVKYFDQEIEKIQKIKVGDWIDLRSAENVLLSKGEYALIGLGVGMILPDGYEAHVLPRSSTPSKFGVIMANSMGVIDNSYSGDSDEWKFPAVALWDTEIKKGDRICQFRIVKNQPGINFETVEHLKDESRGGIGSTGKR